MRRKFKNMRQPSYNSRKRTRDDGDDENHMCVTEQGSPNRPSKRPRKQSDLNVTTEEEESYGDNVQTLENECRKEKLEKKVIKNLMMKTFSKRRQWIQNDSPTVDEVLQKFPPLSHGLRNVCLTIWNISTF